MPTKKKQEYEFRYYEIPQGEHVLALLGKKWIREYGHDTDKLHFHNLLEMGYCVDGEGELVMGGQTIDYSPGFLTMIPQNYPHLTNSKAGTKSYWEYIYFNPEDVLRGAYSNNSVFAKKLLDKIVQGEQYYLPGENERMVTITRLIMEECRVREKYSGECIRGLLLALIVEIARNAAGIDISVSHNVMGGGMDQISAALEYIGMKYMDHIKSKMLAETCNLSETHFRRIFSEYMNMTPMEYINLVRVQQACDLMQRTRYSMEEIAARVGFASVSTFNRNFRKIIGTSPYQFKKSSDNYQGKLLNARVSAKKGW